MAYDTNVYDIGDEVRVMGNFTAEDGITPADPTDVECRVRRPDGTIADYNGTQVIRDAEGGYHVDVVIDQWGTWFYRWVGTGALNAAGEETFSVRRTRFA